VETNGFVDGIYVCNDQVSEKPGNHWFLIYNKNNVVNFIDSFAKDPSFYGLKFFSSKTKKFAFQLQSYFSDVCGEYTVFCSYMLCRRNSLQDISNFFSRTNLTSNDESVKKFCS
jgi:hypothetical protein